MLPRRFHSVLIVKQCATVTIYVDVGGDPLECVMCGSDVCYVTRTPYETPERVDKDG